MNEPTFSICIPNYNYGRYIGETIQSVLDQSYQNFEIIVADNASTDNSVEVIESFKDKRIQLVRNRHNIGFAPNLQRATVFARNTYINVLSSDDQMKPNALETYAKVLNKMGADAESSVLFSQVEGFDERGAITSLIRKASDGFYNVTVPPASESLSSAGGDEAPYVIFDGRDVLRDSLGRLKSFAPFLSIVYPRRLWESIEGYNSVRTIGPDKHFNYKLLSLDPVVVYVPSVLYRYRDYQSDNRVAQKTTLKQPIDDYLYTIEYSQEYLKALGLSRDQIVRSFVDQICLKEGLRQIGRRNYAHAFRLLAFSFASYPGMTLRLSKTYALSVLLALGPLAMAVAPLLYRAYKIAVPDPELARHPVAR
jgi:glycosyltransferase involved in cell wall biosynthesis